MATLDIIDNRFPEPGIDARFETPGVDWRFKDFPDDNRFPEPGIDRRWMGGPWDEWTPGILLPDGEAGFWADGFVPPAFTPELLMTIGQPGFWANLQEAQQ